MNLLSLLLSSMLTSSSVNSVSQKTGISEALIKKLRPLAIPLLIRYLTQNASSQAGATSLLGALTQHTSNRSMADQIQEADTTDGEKIIGHILGNDSDAVVNKLAGETGLGTNEVNSVLGAIAPALLSGLSAANTSAVQQNTAAQQAAAPSALDFTSLLGTFGGAQPQQTADTSGLGLLSSLLGGGTVAQQPSSASLLSSLMGFGTAPQTPAASQASAVDGTELLSILSALSGK